MSLRAASHIAIDYVQNFQINPLSPNCGISRGSCFTCVRSAG